MTDYSEIAQAEPGSDTMLRLITSLTVDQTREYIALEHAGRNDMDVLALMSWQHATLTMPADKLSAISGMLKPAGFAPERLAPLAMIDGVSLHDQSRIHNALMLAWNHVRRPLVGNALAELQEDIEAALHILGTKLGK